MSEIDVYSLLKKAKSLGYSAEILMQANKKTQFGKEPKTRYGQSVDSTGYGMRVIKENRLGFAYSTFLTEKLLENAIVVSRTATPDPSNVLPSASGKFSDVKVFNKKAAEWIAPIKEYVASLEMPKGVNLDGVDAVYSESVYKVVNTEGIDCEDRTNGMIIGFAASAKEGEKVLPSVGQNVFFRESKPDITKQIETVAEKARVMIGAKKNDKKYSEVVFTPDGIESIIGEFMESFYGSKLFLKQTPISEGLDLENKLDITDDNTFKEGIFNYRFDTEGVAKNALPLIKNGEVKNFLYDTYWATKAKKRSTASAMRDYNTTPTISGANIVIDAPIEKNLRDGSIVIDDMLGSHTADTATGDFSLTPIIAWEEKGGEKKGLSNLVVTGNIVSFLKGIVASSKEKTQNRHIVCGDIKVRGISVA